MRVRGSLAFCNEPLQVSRLFETEYRRPTILPTAMPTASVLVALCRGISPESCLGRKRPAQADEAKKDFSYAIRDSFLGNSAAHVLFYRTKNICHYS